MAASGPSRASAPGSQPRLQSMKTPATQVTTAAQRKVPCSRLRMAWKRGLVSSMRSAAVSGR